MTREEAATVIQKSYRGSVVRKQYGVLHKSRPDENNFMKYWCKKWKAKSVFQVLLLYRASKHQDLVYFCQQTHLYNQSILSEIHDSNIQVNLKEIDPRVQVYSFLPPFKSFAYKLPFRLGDVPFFDSNYVCDPRKGSRVVAIYDEEAWDAPIKCQASGRTKNNQNLLLRDKESQTSIDKDSYGNHDNTLSDTPFSRDPHRPMHVAPSTSYSQKSRCQEPKQWIEQKKRITPSPRKNYPAPSNYPPPPPKKTSVNSNHPRQESTYCAPLAVKRGQNLNNPLKEIEEKYRRITSDQSDDPPFNFQAMLRKTNNNRASFKRMNDNVVYNSENYNNNHKPIYKKKFDTRKNSDGTIIAEIAPGLIVRGEVAEL